jgi:hypothetical protein
MTHRKMMTSKVPSQSAVFVPSRRLFGIVRGDSGGARRPDHLSDLQLCADATKATDGRYRAASG